MKDAGVTVVEKWENPDNKYHVAVLDFGVKKHPERAVPKRLQPDHLSLRHQGKDHFGIKA